MITDLSLKNFKGVSTKYKFGAGTLIQGPNFSGKSAIDQAIRGLVLGYIPGVAKNAAGLKMFASDYPMRIAASVIDKNELQHDLEVAFEKVKSTVKHTNDNTLSGSIDEPTRVLFDPTIFFGLGDAARITKACELVQSKGVSPEDIDAALVGVIANHPTLLRHLGTWRNTIKKSSPTVSDLLSASDEFWKNERKVVNQEKSRMQSTVEGVSDLNAADAQSLPPRDEVELYKSELESKLTALRARVTQAETLAASASRSRQRRLEIAPIAESLAEKIDSRAFYENELKNAETEQDRATIAHSESRDALNRIHTRMHDARCSADVTVKLHKAAGEIPETKQEIARVEALIEATEAESATVLEKLTSLNAELEVARKDAMAPKEIRAEEEVRTDDFITGATVGVQYLSTSVISVDESGNIVTHSVEDWRRLSENDEESEEQARMKEYEAAQAISDMVEEIERLTKEDADLKGKIRNSTLLLRGCNDRLVRATVAKESLENTKHIDVPSEEEVTLAQSSGYNARTTLAAAKDNTTSLRTVLQRARDNVAEAKSAAAELARLDSSPETVSTEDVDAMKQEITITEKCMDTANSTLSQIAAAEQDQKRISDAAKKREAVEAEYKLLGKVLEVLTQKKTELVSGSIEAPLKIANKLGAGILKGKLVFEEGEIGMRVGDAFVSARVFSGSETAIVMMGLTAGLAARSKLRVLMLDEIGRFDVACGLKLIANLCGMVDDGDIDQFILIGPKNHALTSELMCEQASGRLSVINV